MDSPRWVTPPDLGSFSQDYSFDLNPIELVLNAAPGSTARIINGAIPDGLLVEQRNGLLVVVDNTIVITGVAVPSRSPISGRFTIRIQQPDKKIADRTFSISLEPVPIPPTWENQQSFLGYQGVDNPEHYQLRATPPPGEYLTYSISTPVSGLTIDPFSGLLTFDASGILSNTTVSFTVMAEANQLSSNIDLYIDVLVSPLAPKWITPAGSIGRFGGGDFVEINLRADDVTGAALTYQLASVPAGFPFNISDTGSLYGRPENPLGDIVYSF